MPPDRPPPTPPLRRFAAWTRAWLTAPDRGRARWMIAGVLAMTLAQVLVLIRFNLWSRDFFDALGTRDSSAFAMQILVFFVLAGASMTAAVYQLYLKQLIQIGWRDWLTRTLVGEWLRDGRQYQLEMGLAEADNPDQRIAEDARVATELAVELSLGILISVSMLVAFIGILWGLSGPLAFSVGGVAVSIPGYMVWAALLYALGGAALTLAVGRRLVGINIRRTAAEADLRFGLTHAREAAEAIGLIGGEPDERRNVAGLFGVLRGIVREAIFAQRRLMWLTSASATLAMIFPTVVAAPAYFAGTISLGGLMQIVAAFAAVQAALSWFVDNFVRIAEWRSALVRLVALSDALSDVDQLLADPGQPTIAVRPGAEGEPERLVFRDVKIALADGTVVIADASAEIGPGERVVVKGESGVGKSTLFRAIAGLWPWGDGEILTPPRAAIAFLPQRTYLPLGPLGAALCYPRAPDSIPEADQAAALERVGLAPLTSRLAEDARWDHLLSVGEQQRLAFARVLLHRPRWVFLDESTAALDEENQDAMMRLLIEELPEAALISICHRPGLEAFHNRTLTLVKADGGASFAPPTMRRPRPAPPAWQSRAELAADAMIEARQAAAFGQAVATAAALPAPAAYPKPRSRRP